MRSSGSVSALHAVCLALLPHPVLPLNVPWSRREAVSALSVGLAASSAVPRAALASPRGGVSWSLDLPESFSVQTQLSSIVRIRVATMFEANDAASGAQVKLLLLPFGQQTGGSLNGDEQLEVAKHFFDPETLPTGPDTVATTLANSVARSPTILSLSREGAASGYQADDNARYVKFGYKSSRCSEPLDDGECFGSLAKRHTLATVSMSSLSQFRTNTERERMKEEGRVRNVNVLWLLTLTAPDASWEKVAPMFENVAASFRVPLNPS